MCVLLQLLIVSCDAMHCVVVICVVDAYVRAVGLLMHVLMTRLLMQV